MARAVNQAVQQAGGGRRGQRRGDRSEVALAASQQLLEAGTARAGAQVGSDPAPTQYAAVAVRNRPTDALTLHGPALRKLVERRASLVHELPCVRLRRAQGSGDVPV